MRAANRGQFDWPPARGLALAALLLVLQTLGCARPETSIIFPATEAAAESSVTQATDEGLVFNPTSTWRGRLKFGSVAFWGLSITARAEPAVDGTWPRLRVELDDVPVRVVVVADSRPIPYWINFAAEPGFADLKLSLGNGGTADDGPTLVIERVELVPLRPR